MKSSIWDRRHFISSALSAASGIVVASSLMTRSAPAAGNRIGVVLFDPRYRSSREFAQQLSAQGAEPISVAQGQDKLWNGSLGRWFSARSGAIAGLTQHSDLLISQIFARELARGRLVFEAMHDSRGSAAAHQIQSTPKERDIGMLLHQSGAAWPVKLATRLARMDSSHAPQCRETVPVPLAQFAADHPGTLFSWLIRA